MEGKEEGKEGGNEEQREGGKGGRKEGVLLLPLGL